MEHVYCTHCKWFSITEDDVPTCKYETECDICDPEDSRPYKDRPYYEKPYVVLPKEICGDICK